MDFLGSNPIIRVNGISLERMISAMNLVDGFPCHGYTVNDNKLVLFRYGNGEDIIKFPTPLSVDATANMTFEWVRSTAYPREPDHDGDNEKGWLIWNDSWGQIEGFGYSSFLAIAPMWIMYGK